MVLRLDPQPTDHILDIGCGIGGPARWIAYKLGCRVTGIDLTPEFRVAARQLNDITGMSDPVTILEGSALPLPLPDTTFDRAYSQNVLMSIADKAGVYREAFRVLKPGSILVLAHLNAGPSGPPDFPQPWAGSSWQTELVQHFHAARSGLVCIGLRLEHPKQLTLNLLCRCGSRDRCQSGQNYRDTDWQRAGFLGHDDDPL
jgi:ubiquinone/menaquinone biosynthesis C-methylase UbiE